MAIQEKVLGDSTACKLTWRLLVSIVLSIALPNMLELLPIPRSERGFFLPEYCKQH